VESVKHRKTYNKENTDPHIIPAHKVRTVKKVHNLSKTIDENQ
ncbi:1646_t:CDS:1, partial [Dentiscutata heterogama]